MEVHRESYSPRNSEAIAVDFNNEDQDGDGAIHWKCIREETGFASYVDYSKRFIETSSFKSKLHKLKKYCRGESDFRNKASYKVICTIIDIGEDGALTSNTFAAERVWNKHASAILKRIRMPGTCVSSRAILLDVNVTFHHAETAIPPELMDVIGLGLRIGAPVVEAMLERHQQKRQVLQDTCREAPFAVIGDSILTIASEYLANESACPPAILFNNIPVSLERIKTWAAIPLHKSCLNVEGPVPWPVWSDIFGTLLRRHLRSFENPLSNGTAAISCAILTLLEVLLEDFRTSYNQNRAEVLDLIHYDYRSDSRDWQGQRLEYLEIKVLRKTGSFEQSVNNIVRFLRCQLDARIIKDVSFSLLHQETHALLSNAHKLELQIRD